MEKSLLEYLISNRLITKEQSDLAAKSASAANCSIAEAILHRGFADEQTIAVAFSKWLNYPLATVDNKLLVPEKGKGLESLVPESFARQNMVLPLFRDNRVLAVAMADPENLVVMDNLKILTQCSIEPCVACKSHLLKALDGFYRKSAAGTEDLVPEAVPAASEALAEEPSRGEKSAERRWLAAIPLHLRLIGGFLVLQLGILVAIIRFVDNTHTQFAKSGIEGQIQTTHKVLLAVLQQQNELLLATLEMLGKDVVLQKAIAVSSRDASTIESAATTIRKRIGLDVLLVSDTKGRLYADESRTLDAHEADVVRSLVAFGPRRKEQTAIVSLGGRLNQLAWVAILEPAEFEVIGILVGGRIIDDKLANQIKSYAQSDLSFAVGGKIMASTLDSNNLAVLEENRKNLVLSQHGLVGPAGARQLVLSVSPSEGLLVYIQQPWDMVLEPLTELNQTLLYLGLGGFVLSVLCAFLTVAFTGL